MEIRVLRYFLTVVREESITRAAEVLHITQPTLRRQFSQLEEETGVRLFHRGSRKITLTNEGDTYSLASAELSEDEIQAFANSKDEKEQMRMRL